MRTILAILSLLSLVATADPVKVAIIDTGYDMKSTWPGFSVALPKICPNGRYNFVGTIEHILGGIVKISPPNTDVTDNIGHGTHVTGLIAKNAEDADYCVIILKYYNPNDPDGNTTYTVNALKKALELKADLVNYSGGGEMINPAECRAVKELLDAGTVVVAAAGNNNADLSVRPFYPAMCDPRVVKVVNMTKEGWRSMMSNYVTGDEISVETEVGFMLESTLPGDKVGFMSGTSQAAAVMTGKLTKKMSDARKDKYLKHLLKKAP